MTSVAEVTTTPRMLFAVYVKVRFGSQTEVRWV